MLAEALAESRQYTFPFVPLKTIRWEADALLDDAAMRENRTYEAEIRRTPDHHPITKALSCSTRQRLREKIVAGLAIPALATAVLKCETHWGAGGAGQCASAGQWKRLEVVRVRSR